MSSRGPWLGARWLGLSPLAPLPWESPAAPSRKARPEEVQAPRWGTGDPCCDAIVEEPVTTGHRGTVLALFVVELHDTLRLVEDYHLACNPVQSRLQPRAIEAATPL